MARWRIRIVRYRDPLPVGVAGLIAGFCFGVLVGMVGLRLMERFWS